MFGTEMISQVDDNNTGEIEFDEFVEILRLQRRKHTYCPSLELAILFKPGEIEKIREQFEIVYLFIISCVYVYVLSILPSSSHTCHSFHSLIRIIVEKLMKKN